MIKKIALLIILILGLVVRLYKIDAPIADWHSWRQADTSAVTRNFIKEGFNPLYPKYDDMSGVAENPIANPGRFRFVEFPIYNMAVYPFYLVFGVDEKYHRLVSVLFSLGSIIFLFLITKKYLGSFTAYLAALIFALLPFNVFFSRTTLPEPTLIFFCLGMIYFIDRWISEGKKRWKWWGLIFAATAFLIKPWAIFFALPLFYLVYKKEGKVFPISRKYLLFALAALVPFALWRLWILQHPEGIPASNWLMNGDHIRFRPAFWWWLVSERLGGEILSVAGVALAMIGLIIKPKNGNYFFHFWLFSMSLYLAIFATGNVRHNYYQVILVPTLSVFVALGLTYLLKGINGFIPRFWTIMLALFLVPLMFYFTWKDIKGLYQINNPAIVMAGKRADQLLPKDAVVVAPYNGDTAFLYQTNRPGWPVVALPLRELMANYGVSAYVSTAKDAKTKWAMRHFEVLEDKPDYVIINLMKVTAPFNDQLDPEQ